MFSQSIYDPFGRESGFGGPFVNLGGRRSSPYERRRRQELARRQRIAEEERRRRADLERRQRAEEEMARIHEMEMLPKAHGENERMRRRHPYRTQPSEKEAGSYPPGTVVLGPDGNLYKVIESANLKKESQMVSRSALGVDRNPSASEKNGEKRIDEDESSGYSSDSSQESDSSEEWHEFQDISGDSEMKYYTGGGHVGESAASASPMRRHVPVREITVEDVPDEEDEELLEMRSVWRNRIPSPGQWMEPVESFRGQ